MCLTAVALGLWLSLLYYVPSQYCGLTIKALPVWGLLIFGMYSIVVVFYNVSTFNSYPQEIDVLRKDIQDARIKLESRGIFM